MKGRKWTKEEASRAWEIWKEVDSMPEYQWGSRRIRELNKELRGLYAIEKGSKFKAMFEGYPLYMLYPKLPYILSIISLGTAIVIAILKRLLL